MEPENEQIDFRRYTDSLRRRWPIIIGTVVVAVVIALAATYAQQPVYEANADVLAAQTNFAGVFPNAKLRSATNAKTNLQNQLELVGSTEVTAAAAKRLGDSTSAQSLKESVDATSTGEGTEIIRISAEGSTPNQAARRANEVAAAFAAVEAAKATDSVNQLISEIQIDYDLVSAEANTIQDEMNDALASSDADATERFLALTPRQNAANSRKANLEKTLDELKIQARLLQEGNVEVISAAVAPGSPASPSLWRNLVLAIVGGLIVGIALAFGVEYFDRRVRNVRELAEAAQTVPLGSVPAATAQGTEVERWGRKRKAPERPVVFFAPSPAEDAFRRIRTNLEQTEKTKRSMLIGVTSAGVGEGRTTVTVNLACAFARARRKVIIVDADLRTPTVHSALGLDPTPGLSEFLSTIHSGEPTPDDAMQSFTPEDPSLSIWVLPGGDRAVTAAGLLSSDTMSAVLKDLRSQCDLVIVDLPPVLATSDAATLARSMDAVILVGLENRTRDDSVEEAAEILRSAGAPLTGVILSGVPRSDASVAASFEYYDEYVTPPPEEPADEAEDKPKKKRADVAADGDDTGEMEWTASANPPKSRPKAVSNPKGSANGAGNGRTKRRRVKSGN